MSAAIIKVLTFNYLALSWRQAESGGPPIPPDCGHVSDPSRPRDAVMSLPVRLLPMTDGQSSSLRTPHVKMTAQNMAPLGTP